MYVLYMTLWIASAACLFLAATEPYWRKPTHTFKVLLFPLGALLFVLVPLIQLARS